MFDLENYTFALDNALIAETATHPAHDARLMIIDRATGDIVSESTYWYLDQLIDPRTVIFLNNSKVLRARLILRDIRIESSTGAHHPMILREGEIFFLKNLSENHFEALVRPGKKLRPGATFALGKYRFSVVASTEKGRIIEIKGGSIFDCLEEYGQLPLPPYIHYSPEKEADYQSAIAEKLGSVAAPTAALHFTEELLEKLPQCTEYITLHVGLSTFASIETDDIRAHHMHTESVEVDHGIFERIFDYKNQRRHILAIGTTACRTLESLPSLWRSLDEDFLQKYSPEVCDYWNTISANADPNWIEHIILCETNISCETRAYIFPGYRFAVIDELITNFHLPKSSLLVLVAALIGHDALMRDYNYAIEHEYRFFSFGDGMYIR